ncbi:hypothetical protein DQ239_19795 [Blastococcus sp. TF02-09]|uniref:hypothetical protein n=1 Tax=Blastococcus sp. TF02-09 TaxID=2250576 RepID=UPI000DEAEB30|nr:hypothetical protein [Blastococcus sp. TF02-9]RBY74415.1 hypothetical protein DQ239_19795 [Blastococcus sp. TF02-9]
MAMGRARSGIGDRIDNGFDQQGDEHELAVLTWRYLRVGLIALAIGLAVSVLREAWRADCVQTSISAYYYTPAQGVVVGVLVAIGACLICLRGASDGEDVLLNVAGICAPFVALVPTPNENRDCGKVLVADSDRLLYVGNTVTGLLVVAWFSLAFLAVLTVSRWMRKVPIGPSLIDLCGYAGVVVALAVTNVVFVAERQFFLRNAHHVAAISLFVFVFFNVCLNAAQRYRAKMRADDGRARIFNWYTWIALAMLVDVGVHIVLAVQDWSHWVLTIEASLITLFVGFWIVQSAERWDNGVSPVPIRTDETPTSGGGAGVADGDVRAADASALSGSGATAGRP